MWQKHAAGGERPVHFARGYAQSQRFEYANAVSALRMPCGKGVPPVGVSKRPSAIIHPAPWVYIAGVQPGRERDTFACFSGIGRGNIFREFRTPWQT